MIFTYLLELFYNFISFIIGILPIGNLPTVVTSSFATIFGIANQFSYVIPIATLMKAFVVVIAFDGAILGWHFLNWIIRKIPGMQ